MPWELLIVFVIVVLGGFIQGVTGFGCGLVVMGFLPLLFTIKDSTLIVISLLTVTSLIVVVKMYKYIEYKGLLLITVCALAGRIVAFFFLNAYGEMEFLQLWLGLFLIAMALYMLLEKGKQDTTVSMKPVIPIVLGFIGGFIGGVFAVGGPFFVVYFLMLFTVKHKYIANLQVTFFLTNLFTLVIHGVHGDLYSAMYVYIAIGIAGVFLGTTLGLKLFEKLPTLYIKRFAISLVLVAGLNLIVF